MLNQFKILTVTHKKTNLSSIGDFVLKTANKDELKERLENLKEQFGMQELFYLSTCNRVLYFFYGNQDLDAHFASHFFQSVNPNLNFETLSRIEEIAYLLEGEAALNHFFEVAASIDSLVVGERQILGQIREAYEQCRTWGLIQDQLHLVMRHTIVAAKEVYAKTRIGDKPVSVVSLAVQKMLRLNLPKTARILLVGAGQTNALVAKFLLKHHFENVVVFNRSLERAQHLAQSFTGEAYTLNHLANYQDGFDCMIVCTGATTPIITKELYRTLIGSDKNEKVVIDLAIPNNVSKEVIHLSKVNYIEIEGLRQLAKENLAFREQEISKAKVLLTQHLQDFPIHLKQRQIEIAMKGVPVAVKAVKAKALNEVFKNEVESLDDETRELLERMMTYMEQKCIGIPMKAAREVVIDL